MQATFRRGFDTLIVQLRTEIATGEYLVVSILPGGKEQADRFGSQEQALAYFKFMEDRLGGEQWKRDLDPAQTPPPPKTVFRQAVHAAEPSSPTEPRESDDGSGKYALGRPLQCPHCHEWIRDILVVRLVREQAPFTSTLPRSGRALVCPSCDGLLSAELSRFI